MKLEIDLTDDKLAMLLRSALLDDAKNVGQRMASLKAEIYVDDDEASIILDEDLWEDVFSVPTVDRVAGQLGLEVEWVGSFGGSDFAWPGMAQHFKSTSDYLAVLMEAYHGQKSQSKGGPS